MNIKHIAKRGRNLYDVPIDLLGEEPGWNGRLPGKDLDEYIADLASYIQDNGVPGGPLVIKWVGENLVVRDGHCRLQAAKISRALCGLPEILECVMFDKAGNETDEIALQFTANSSRPLTPIEMAPKVKRLHDLKLDNQKIAKKIGKSPSMVSYLLSLSAAPEEVKNMVKENKVSATMAVNAVRESPSEAPGKLREAVSRAEAEGRTKATVRHTVKPKANPLEGFKKLLDTLNDEQLTEAADLVAEEIGRRE